MTPITILYLEGLPESQSTKGTNDRIIEFGAGWVFGHQLAQLPYFTKKKNEAQINEMTQQGHVEERKSQSQVDHACLTTDTQMS